MPSCITGKKMFATEVLAEEALISAHSRFHYSGTGPIAIYKCEDCGHYHLTSKGTMNPRLANEIAAGKIKREREANFWNDKLKKR